MKMSATASTRIMFQLEFVGFADVVVPPEALVPFLLQRVEHRDEPESDRAGEGSLEEKPGPAGLLDQVDRVLVGELESHELDERLERMLGRTRVTEIDADVVSIQRAMIRQLVDAGCRYVQIDAPGYTAYVDEPSLAAMREIGRAHV